MKMGTLDKKATAIANGYSEGQAEALELWDTGAFVRLINDMIRPDNKPKEWVFKEDVKGGM